ncbi:MAG TPA: class I SAM-dependent methyltransferase [Verrucomicrobiota bacterium]|nr:class I SAM-dependent methyltransferase [Verrucomicrobiota bacterium]
MRRTPNQLAAGALARLERLLRRCRRRLTRPRVKGRTDRLNDAEEWAEIYDSAVEPVTALSSPVARALADLTHPGEIVLETGCGAARLSAELATAGRQIELADFSETILVRARALFKTSGLPEPRTTLCDLTRRLPWPDRAVDVSWSSGVLEHWTDEELVPIVGELARISRRLVVSLVPYAGCLPYRWGKAVAEGENVWPYGREIPRTSLRPVFEKAGLRQIAERTLWSEAGLNFLQFVDSEVHRTAQQWFDALADDDPIRLQQGYLLCTVGEVGTR